MKENSGTGKLESHLKHSLCRRTLLAIENANKRSKLKEKDLAVKVFWGASLMGFGDQIKKFSWFRRLN